MIGLDAERGEAEAGRRRLNRPTRPVAVALQLQNLVVPQPRKPLAPLTGQCPYCVLWGMKKPLRLRLPFGTLKVATYLQLSSAEHDGLVRTKRFGRLYFVWKPTGTASSSRDTV